MGSRRMRLGIAIVVGVLVVCLAAALLGVALAPPDASGYGPDAERSVVGFCTRSAPDVSLLAPAPTAVSPDPGSPVLDDPQDTSAACRCAYEHLARTVPWARFVEIDEAMRSSSDPPPELTDAVRACGAEPAS